MTDAETILKMIETASAGNREIDGAVARFLGWHRITPSQAKAQGLRLRDGGWVAPGHHVGGRLSWEGEYSRHCPEFSRSRDALKAIRPKGWFFAIRHEGLFCASPKWDCKGSSKEKHLYGPFFPTEELAELHAIIQAIEYERTK